MSCPKCGSTSVRLTTPLKADVQAFRCNDCGGAWSDPEPASDRADDRRPPVGKKNH